MSKVVKSLGNDEYGEMLPLRTKDYLSMAACIIVLFLLGGSLWSYFSLVEIAEGLAILFGALFFVEWLMPTKMRHRLWD